MPPPSIPLSAIRQPAFLYDADGRVVAANDLADALAGRPLAGCSAKDVARIFRARHADGTLLGPAELPAVRALAGGEVVDMPFAITTADGRTMHLLATASPIRDGATVAGALVIWQDVTGLRQAEETLRQRVERGRVMVNLPTDMALLLDPRGTILDINDTYAAVLGQSPRDLVGRSVWEAMPPEVVPDRREYFYRAAESRQIVRFENTRHGRWYDTIVEPVLSDEGEVIHVAVIARDITDRKRTENALRESEERLRDVLDLSLDAIYRRNLITGRFDYQSPVNETLTGFSAEEFGAFSLAEFTARIHPDDRAKADASVTGAMQAACTRASGMIEYRFRHQDGSYRWLSDHFTIQAGTGGRPRHRVGVVRDVTRRREMEAALREREERLNLALDAAVIGTFDWNIATGEETWDDRVRMQWDLPLGASVTHAIFEAGIHPDDLPAVQDAIGRALDPAGDRRYAAEYRVIGLCDGVERRITSRGRTCFDGGRPVRMIGTTVDVTELRRAEEALQRYAERLAASNEELRRFAYVASHDLQEPLRSIVSFSQLLERRYKGKLDQDADEFIGFIVEGGIRMQRLIQDLLAFSRVETMAGTPVETDPREAVAGARTLLGASLAEAGARLEVGALPAVVVDPRQLEQVFTNLVSNAVKYRHPERPLAIAIGARCVDGMVEFAVNDNGIGIEKEYFDRIFEMFRRLHTHDAYEGTGIGLAVVKRIVERHGGRIWVESVPGEGSTFVFTLPAA